MSTKLIIEGQEIDLGEALIKRTYQNNLLQDPGAVNAPYSNVFTVPATQPNRVKLGFADELGSTTDLPYRVLDGQLFDQGAEELPFARCEIQRYKKSFFDIQVFSGIIEFFDAIGDAKLADLDLSAYNHSWNFATITANTTGSNGVFLYDLYDRGKSFSRNALEYFNLYPSVFAKAIWDKIFSQAGFAYDMFPNPMFERLKLPMSRVYTFPDDYRKAREFKVTSNAPDVERIAVPAEELLKFNFVEEGYVVDENGGYDLNTYRYTVDAPRIMKFDAGVEVYLETNLGTIKAILQIRVNGEVVSAVEFESPGGGFGGAEFQFMTISTGEVSLKTGDYVEAWVKIAKVSDEAVDPDWAIYFSSISAGTPYFSGTVLPEFPKGGEIELAKWLPDMSQKDFIISMVNIFGFGFYPEKYSSLIKVRQLKHLEENIPNAVDMSGRIDYNDEPELSYTIPGYAQNNRFLWQPDDTVQEGYGDGVLPVDNQRLEVEKDLIESPFAATEERGGLLVVPMFKVKANTIPVEYETQQIEPRLVIHKPDTLPVTVIEKDNAGTVISSATVNLHLSYFKDPAQDYDLDWNTLIRLNYSVLAGMLNRAKFLKAVMVLNSMDINNLDFTRPWWIGEYQEYFYLERIVDYSGPGLTDVELIRL